MRDTNIEISLPDRTLVTNKGDAGKVLIIGSDKGMAGASYFSAEASYRCGAGLVEIMSHPENRTVLQTLIPEAIFTDWNSSKINKADAVVIGVGIGKSDFAVRLLEKVLTLKKAFTVIDADALNIMSENKDLLNLLSPKTVITPHIREMSRLTGLDAEYILDNPVKVAEDFSQKYNTNVVLKNKVTYIALSDGEVFCNKEGSSALSKGGSGDILTGVIASFVAQGVEVKKAIPYSVYLHSLAGKRAGEKLGERSTLARDILNELGNCLK